MLGCDNIEAVYAPNRVDMRLFQRWVFTRNVHETSLTGSAPGLPRGVYL